MIVHLPENATDNISFDFETEIDNILPVNIKAQGKAHITGELTQLNSGWLAEGKIKYGIEYHCDRCAKILRDNRTVAFEEIFKTDNDEEQYSYQGNEINLTQLVIDAIIFDIPGKLLCSAECKGLCPICGTNLNERACDCETNELNNNPFNILKDLGGDK